MKMQGTCSQQQAVENVDDNDNSREGAAPGAAVSAENDPDLAAVIDHWPDLPAVVKSGILALVKAAREAPSTP